MTAPLPALYVLTGEYLAAAEKLAELDLPEQVVRDTLESLTGPLEEKATNVAQYARNLEANAEAIASAIAGMESRRLALAKRAEQLRAYLKENMERAGITKIESPWFVLSIRKNPPGVTVFDRDAIPDAYMRIPEIPLPQPDKGAIKSALKEGKDVPGARLEQGTRIDIK